MTGRSMPAVPQGSDLFRLMVATLICVWTRGVADEDPPDELEDRSLCLPWSVFGGVEDMGNPAENVALAASKLGLAQISS
jgi:hypothetical protein